MEGPPLGPGGEDITWPEEVAPGGRKASSTRKIKRQTSNLQKRVQYVGHVLQNGQIFPSPAKTEGVWQWQHGIITTAKQLKGLLGLVGWHQVYIPKFAEMAAPFMDTLRGKYQYAPPEATDEKTDTNGPKKRKRIKWSPKEARIHWSDEMKKTFEGLKSALNAATGLYLPKPRRPWRIRCDASVYAIWGALEQEQADGGYHAVAFFACKLQGQWTGQGGSTRNTGQYDWTHQEKETYAVVACLLKFQS